MPGKERKKNQSPMKQELHKLKQRSKGIKNQSSVLPKKSNFIGDSGIESKMAYSMDPSMIKQKVAQASKKRRGDWGFANGPVRLNHSHGIDFSGTGGSGNAIHRMERKEILSNLLESGNFDLLTF